MIPECDSVDIHQWRSYVLSQTSIQCRARRACTAESDKGAILGGKPEIKCLGADAIFRNLSGLSARGEVPDSGPRANGCLRLVKDLFNLIHALESGIGSAVR